MFVESVLRYGLPVNFQGMILLPQKKTQKKLRDTLNQLYAHLDSAGGSGDVRILSDFNEFVTFNDLLFSLKCQQDLDLVNLNISPMSTTKSTLTWLATNPEDCNARKFCFVYFVIHDGFYHC